MTKQVRLDVELVRRGLTASRAEAQRAIASGTVLVRGLPAGRAAALVSTADAIDLAAPAARFVSRGGDKLAGALGRFEVPVERRRWLDAGASTGGFTDCLLQAGAAAVIAADVGYGQLAWSLRNDPRVVVMERVNVRTLEPADLPWAPEGVTADLSFISLTTVLPALARVATDDADHLFLVKPQFEGGPGSVGKGGVVRDPEVWLSALHRVVGAAATEGLFLAECAPSELKGPAGNVEFFVHLVRGQERSSRRSRGQIERAVAEAVGRS